MRDAHMLDTALLLKHTSEVSTNLARKGYVLDNKTLSMLSAVKSLETELDLCRCEANLIAKQTAELKRNNQNSADAVIRGADIRARINTLDMETKAAKRAWEEYALTFPNILHPLVPDGSDEQANVLMYTKGVPRNFDFEIKDHVDLGATGMNFDDGVKLAGSRFVVLTGFIAKLERALTQFMLDLHTEKHGYIEVAPPFIANAESLFGTGQLPKFEDDLFSLGSDLYLIPTGEVPLTNLFRDSIIDAFPKKVCAYTPCFRKEAGSYGRDTRGMIRQHQFDKVELVQIVHPDNSLATLDELTCDAERVLNLLELPYRRMLLCAGDTSFSSSITYDLEVWLPAQNKYREISSCSSFGDFQSRRLKIRFKDKETGKSRLAHTINGSGLAVGRTLAALLENHQKADGTIHIPDALKPYMNSRLSS
jgi:seryl-tRNA synthetase